MDKEKRQGCKLETLPAAVLKELKIIFRLGLATSHAKVRADQAIGNYFPAFCSFILLK